MASASRPDPKATDAQESARLAGVGPGDASPSAGPGMGRTPQRRRLRLDWRWEALSLGSLAAIAVLLWLLYQIRGTILVLVASLFFAYLLDPLVARLARVRLGGHRMVGRKSAAAVVVVGAVGLIVGALYWGLPILWGELQRLGSEVPGYLARVEEWLRTMSRRRGMGLPPEVWISMRDQLHGLIQQAGEGAAARALTLVRTLPDLLGLLVIPVGGYYILADGGSLRRDFVNGLPVSWRPTSTVLLAEVDRSLEAYVRGQALVVLVAGTIAIVLFTVLGVRYSLALGILAGLAEVVPFLGAFMMFVVITLITSDRGLGYTAGVLGAYMVLNQINNYWVTPRLMGKRLELHPFIIILAVLAGSALGGLLGALLALPMAAIVVSLGAYLWGAGRAPEPKSK